MKRKWTTWAMLVALSATTGGAILAQQYAGDRREDRDRNQQNRDREDEVRVHYDDDRGRLSIDVDEDIRFRDDSRRDWAREGEIDLRYDTDRHDLRASGEGTIDVDRAASQMGRWWQSWWEEERRARRSRNASEGSDMGAYEFIRQYDENDDRHLSRNELPTRMRDDFRRVDRNDDDYLSRTELRNYGRAILDQQYRSTTARQASARNTEDQDDRTWSQWWASWWSDDRATGDNGTRQLLRQYDANDDGYLSWLELPQRMRDDFDRVDRNNDDYLSAREIREHGNSLRDERRGYSRETVDTRTQRDSYNEEDDRTWSQWWASWWSEGQASGKSSSEIAASGAREFIRRHDRNDDDYLVRSEMPRRMYDEFAQIDANDDRYLSIAEIRDHASQRSQFNRSSPSSDAQSASRSSQDSNAADAAYVFVIDVDPQEVKLERLQNAYKMLSKIDSNSDGQIAREELESQRQKVAVEFCEQRFDKRDQDGDGQLTRSEAEGSMFVREFDQFDQNGDGRLTKSEVRQAVQQKLETSSRSSSNDSSDNQS